MNVSWTSEQISAITSPRDVLLSASAGTGKTTTIVGRIMWALGLEVGRDRETGEPVRPCEAPCRLVECDQIGERPADIHREAISFFLKHETGLKQQGGNGRPSALKKGTRSVARGLIVADRGLAIAANGHFGRTSALDRLRAYQG